ncbi:MAG: hypothetical protein NT067_04155 [Candidatus Diapherotrites archaeon]|nr:hypothetical protein [Candidatus Diapherotrites archaeon]
MPVVKRLFERLRNGKKGSATKPSGVFPSARWPILPRERYEPCWRAIAGKLGNEKQVSEEGLRLLLLSGIREYRAKTKTPISRMEFDELFSEMSRQYGFPLETVKWLCDQYARTNP